MIEIILFLEFLKNIFINPNINLANINQTLAYEDFTIEQPKKIQIDENKISAKNVLIKELNGQTLFEKNSLEKKPIASLTKLLTAIVALQNYDKDDKFYIKETFLENESAEKSTNFKKGEIYNRDDLLNIMLISSSNISALALAEKIGKENFIDKMNEVVKNLALKNSYFFEPTGFSEKNFSNLEDLYFLTKEILKNYPEIFEISRKSTFYIDNKGYFYNTNYILPKYQNFIIGSKTGFTEKAGQCLILIVKFPNSPLIFIGLLDSKDRIKDSEYLIKKLKEFYSL